jgi:hypothetical protein
MYVCMYVHQPDSVALGEEWKRQGTLPKVCISVCMYVYVCMYVCMYINPTQWRYVKNGNVKALCHMYACIRVYEGQLDMYVCMHVHERQFDIYICVCMYVCMYAYIYGYIHTHTQLHTVTLHSQHITSLRYYIYIYIYIYVYIVYCFKG